MENQNNEQMEAIRQSIRDLHVMHTHQKILILNALERKFGKEVGEIVEKTIGEATGQQYYELVKNNVNKSIEMLIKVLWEPLRKHGYEFSVENKEGGVQIICTACPWAKLFKNLKGEAWGYRIYCAADDYLVDAFNAEIGMKRDKTLMEGHDCCNHFYYYKDSSDQEK